MAIMKSLLVQLRHPANASAPAAGSGSVKLDIVSQLPFELHDLVLSYLQPGDVDAALGACRRWRDIWLSDEIWPKLAKRWFPGLEEHIRKSAADGQDMGEMFRRALHKIQRRLSGRFASALHHQMHLESDRFFTLSKEVPVLEGGVHSYDDVDGLESCSGTYFPRFMMYNNGRIVWWPDAYVLPYLAVVDDLRTRRRRAYLFPNNRGEKQGFKTAMSDKLLLMGREKTIHAWHLELDRLCSTKVPEQFVRCIAEGETVLIVTKNAELYLWRFGRDPQHIDVTGCYEKGPLGTSHIYDFTPGQLISSHNAGSRLIRSETLVDFIISPSEENVFFVVTLTPASLKALRVSEIRNGKLVGTYCMERNEWNDFIMMSLDFTNLRWEKVDSYGGYCLMQAIFPTSHRPSPHMTSESACRFTDDSLVSVCFNIYTKSFTIPHYHHMERHSHGSACQIWNGRIAASETDSPRGPVLSLHLCAGLEHPYDRSSPTPIYATTPSRQGDLWRRQQVPFKSDGSSVKFPDAEFALDSDQQLDGDALDGTSTDSLLTPGIKRLVGDDDFLVLIVRESYTIWSFGNEIPERVIDNRRGRWRNLIR